ncbi:MAG TPA: outer membrane lipoprotein-sorting protein [Azospirillaceae bacterium]|nr:outer membrane lipoprotein-sorting protein [Azospirillaceae bacterium]
MFTRRVFLAASLATVALPAVGLAAASTAEEILARTDAVRNPDKPFALTTTLTEFRSGTPASTMVVKVYSKADTRSGQYRTLVRFLEPVRDQGKLMLRDGNVLWFYDPASKASVRLSGQQRLMGQASNGDVVTANFHKDYSVGLGAEEVIADADRQSRPCWKLELKAVNDSVAYFRIELWVDKANDWPIKGKFYSDSGRLLKVAYYRKFEDRLGRMRPTETVIIDGVDTSLVTRMAFADHGWGDIPDAWFQRDFLPRFKGD